MPPRVLYLHSFDQCPGSQRQRQLENVVGGKMNLRAPDLKSRHIVTWGVTFYLAFIAIVVATVTILWVFVPKIPVMLPVVVVSILGAVLAYILGGRFLINLILNLACERAERHFKEFKPNVIAASAFGAAVLFKMKIPKIPLILLSPAQDAFARYFFEKKLPSINGYPYVAILHGELDQQVPTSDSIRLAETARTGNCKLEIIKNDNHKLLTLKEEELRDIVNEVYEKGKKNAFILLAEGSTDIDKTYFSEDEEEV